MRGTRRPALVHTLSARARLLAFTCLLLFIVASASFVEGRDYDTRYRFNGSHKCLGTNPFGYQGGLAALETVRVLRHAWVAGDQSGVDQCIANARAKAQLDPAPLAEHQGSAAMAQARGPEAGLTFTNEPAVETDPRTGEETARVASRWEGGAYLEFTVSLTGDPQVIDVEEFVPPIDYEASAAVLQHYLADLANGEFESAAVPLAAGDERFERRRDLDPLEISGTSTAGLERALAAYCSARCAEPQTISNQGLDRRIGFLLSATFEDGSGHDFVVWGTDRGTSYVRGLPPPAEPE